jgi:hypothetical protein
MEPEPEPELRWIDAGVSELRADICQVKSTRGETALLFGTRQPAAAGGGPLAKLERRVLLSPRLAKQLAVGLAGALRELEARGAMENATPAGSIVSAATDDDAPAAALPLLRLVRGLGAGFGFEKSFKMSAAGLLDDRIILGLRTRLADPGALLGVCRGIGMPQDFAERFAQALPQANTVGFGYEGDGRGGGLYKAYLEFWDRLWQRVQSEPRNTDPAPLFLGFKWDASDAARRALAHYTCYPLLSVSGIERRLERLYEGRRDSPSLQATRRVLADAARRLGAGSFVYVEAAEEGNPRQSFDLNFYKARLRLGELQGALQALCAGYAISAEALEKTLAAAGDRQLGHLSGGIGRDGRDFLTVYYELEAL